ncbi:hypothetical protein pb186bvf_012237, partial [Paramecium bursaria]
YLNIKIYVKIYFNKPIFSFIDIIWQKRIILQKSNCEIKLISINLIYIQKITSTYQKFVKDQYLMLNNLIEQNLVFYLNL